MTRSVVQDPEAAQGMLGMDEGDTGQHYQTLYDALPVAVFVCDRDAVIQHYNRRAAELWRREPAIGVERHCGSVKLWLQDGTHLPHARSPMMEVLRTGKECRSVEVSIERPDGSLLPVIVNFCPLRNAQGHVTGVLTTFDDISELRQAQSLVVKQADRAADIAIERDHAKNELEQQRRLFETILSTTPDLIYVFDLDHRFVYANATLLGVWGRTSEEAVGRTCLELDYDPRQAAMIDGDIDRVIASGQSVQGEMPYTGTNGYRIYDYILTPILDSNGEVEAVAGATRDATKRRLDEEALRLSEHRLAQVFKAAPAFMAVLRGPELVFANANPAYFDLVGQGRGILGKPLMEALPELADQPFPSVVRGVIESGEAFHGKGVRVLLKRAVDAPLEERWVDFVFEPLRAPDGSISGVLAHGVDLTERVVAEAALRDLAEELSEAARRKDEFLATLAHELRNPLAPISNALHILRLADSKPELVETVFPIMERQVGQLVRLVDDLLDVSRISRGRLELRRERVDLVSTVGDAVDASRPLIERMRHDLTVSVPPGALYVDADPARLAQILGNLLTNACKFSDPCGKIQVSLERDGPCAVIRVCDSGIGIAGDQLGRVFNAFTQLDISLERSVSGLGIGLSLVKSLVEKHGGTVEVDSAGIGHGSQFTVRLPCGG